MPSSEPFIKHISVCSRVHGETVLCQIIIHWLFYGSVNETWVIYVQSSESTNTDMQIMLVLLIQEQILRAFAFWVNFPREITLFLHSPTDRLLLLLLFVLRTYFVKNFACKYILYLSQVYRK
jgi:hypothetical protein